MHKNIVLKRILAIDYGLKRVGLAATDPMQIIANGMETVATSEVFDFLKKYISEHPVARFVVGYPRQMDGSDSQIMPQIKKFTEKLRKTFPEIEIAFYDERFTSVLAHKAMLAGGLHKKDRQNKALADKISATIILQDYLEQSPLTPKGGKFKV